MNALTIHQPYAHLIAIGSKFVENRGRATRYRGLLAIHASLSRMYLPPHYLNGYPDMAFGAIVAVAHLANCFSINHIRSQAKRGGSYWRRIADHVHTEGPYCWILEDVTRLEDPIPIAGRQGLWRVPQDIALKLHDAWRPQ
jgi:hypothetical protein